jgi:hypothetical protein
VSNLHIPNATRYVIFLASVLHGEMDRNEWILEFRCHADIGVGNKGVSWQFRGTDQWQVCVPTSNIHLSRMAPLGDSFAKYACRSRRKKEKDYTNIALNRVDKTLEIFSGGRGVRKRIWQAEIQIVVERLLLERKNSRVTGVGMGRPFG